jgi:monooxygenase
MRQVAQALPPGYDVERHFGPRYGPWDQRLCLVPDGDLFDAIGAGRASVATGTIAAFTPEGLRLDSGEEVAADLVVTATGLELEMLGGVALSVDGREVQASHALLYKSLMLADVPNLVVTFGYTNASWTLKADLTARWMCRLVQALDRRGARFAVARRDPAVREQPFLDFSSGYVTRAADRLPKQGDRDPWRARQSYWRDLFALRFGRLEDGTLRFER